MNFYHLLPQFVRRSVSSKILLLTGSIGVALLLAMAVALIHHMAESLADQNRIAVQRIANSAGKGLQAIMLAGQAQMADDYISQLKRVEGIETMRIFRHNGSEAFRPAGAGQIDDTLQSAFQQAVAQRKEIMVASTGPDGVGRLTVLYPLPNREACHQCHGGDHAVRGVLQFTVSQEESEANIRAVRWTTLGVVAVVVPLLLLMTSFSLQRIIRHPLLRLREAINRLSGGDLTHTIPLPAEPLDDFGYIASDVNRMANRFSATLSQVMLQTNSMSASVTELNAARDSMSNEATNNLQQAHETAKDHTLVSRQVEAISRAAQETTSRVGTISAATEQLSANVAGIASGAEQTSHNISMMATAAEEITANLSGVNDSLQRVDDSVNSVAEAIGQMSHSLEQVRQQCLQASQDSCQASAQARGTYAMMNRLESSTREIGKVLQLIRSIANQTSMLALNASIEAAVAGEVGRGFAVVANEVKELARQTDAATQLINDRIQEIQSSSHEVMQANQVIVENIEKIDQANGGIVHSVEEQSHSAGAIAQSIQQVAFAAGEVTRSAGELNLAASDIARSALRAANEAASVARNADEAATAAATLAQQNERIHGTAEQLAHAAVLAADATNQADERVRVMLRSTTLVTGAIHHTSMLIHSVAIPGRKLQDSVQDLQVAPEPFAVASIKSAHLKWLGRLENVIRGRSDLKPEQVASGRECDFGKWYYNEGVARYGHLAVFRQIEDVHLKVHEVAKECVALVHRDGNIAAAEAKMDEFGHIKDRLFDLLDALYEEAIALT
ncbi:MAG: CZB domain-containing protein [Magnetococcales bacterium]|nr:CZB domain-containing protein [Magnetococcales bacterium]MBF0116103.1 CZB domain-containing protein [Magnetococcales bacterium]